MPEQFVVSLRAGDVTTDSFQSDQPNKNDADDSDKSGNDSSESSDCPTNSSDDSSKEKESDSSDAKQTGDNSSASSDSESDSESESESNKENTDKKDDAENKSGSDDKKEGKKDDVKSGDAKKDDEKKDETKKNDVKKEEAKPETVELKKEPIRITVKLNGTFESKRADSVRLKGDEFSAFELQEVVLHGAKVRKGDILIRFNPKKYDEALAEKKRALRLSEIALQEEEINVKQLESLKSLQKELMERDKKEADEDVSYYFNVDQLWYKKMLDVLAKMESFNLDTAREELRQLEKMYTADDLVEDTEEFALKRAKFSLEMEEFFSDFGKIRRNYIEEYGTPRKEMQMRHSAKVRELDYQKSREIFGFALEQAKLRLEKTRETHAKLAEQFEKFEKDKKMLLLRAPSDGIVYYGDYND
ncbi:MAG: hypothetical protein ACRCUY_05670 [Thermoguttaceae bacterium]